MSKLYHRIKKTKEFKHLLIVLLSGLFLFILLIWGAFFTQQRENEITHSVLHSQEEVLKIERAISLVKDYEASVLRFTLTRQDQYKQPLPEVARSLDHAIAHLRKLIARDTLQQRNLDSLSFYLHKKVAFSSSLIRLRQEKGLAEAIQLTSGNDGLVYMNKIRQIAREMQRHARKGVAQKKKQSAAAVHLTNQMLVASLAFFVILLLYVLWKGWRQEQEQKKAGEKLTQHEERYQALIENNKEAIVLQDAHFTIHSWSPAAERILGWTKEETCQPGWRIPVHPGEQERLYRQQQEALRYPGVVMKGLSQVHHKNGHFVWLETEVINLLHRKCVQAILINFRDVSDRVKAELEVQHANTLLEKAVTHLSRIMDSSRDVICAIDAQGRFLQVSAAAATVWGYAPEALIGRPYLALVADQDKEASAQVAASLMSGITIVDFENHYVHPEGRLVPM